MKVAQVALIGRPNTGKSTLLNNLVGQKVAITSPRPQTTQTLAHAVYEDERGQIIFIDTPGIFAKVRSPIGRQINTEAERILKEDVDVILYIIDHTRPRGLEENRVLGMVRKIDRPKILVINKIDKRTPDFLAQYKFLEDEFDKTVALSALKNKNIRPLLDTIFAYAHEGEKYVVRQDLPTPALNLTSKEYIEENIREKAFLTLRRELPYHIRVEALEIKERKNGPLYIKARIVTDSERYKRMIIGRDAKRIKQISMMARRELELATGNKIYLELTVEVE